MKKIFILFFTLFTVVSSINAQNFPGFRSGNFTGVNGVFFNPANIADSRYRWDVNLFAIHAGLGNSNASFKLKNIGDAFSGDVDSLLFGSSNKNTNGAVNLDIFGPSVMFNTSKKLSFGITTRFRTMANIVNIDGNFVQAIDNNVDQALPLNLTSKENQKISLNGWTDFGGSMGMVLADKGKHFLKGGITLKYLAGSANSYASINNLTGTIDEDLNDDIFLTNTTGRVAIGYSGIDINDNFEAKDAFKFNGKGFGGDIGFIYEYRPDQEKTERYQNKYKIKVGLALLDVGSIKYKPKADQYGDYSINVPAGQQWYPNTLDGQSISEMKQTLDNSPYFTNNNANTTSYTVNLPTTLQANVDWSLNKGFFVDLAGQLSLADKDATYTSFYYNAVTLTPRYEGRNFGFYVPLNYNELTKFNAGISLRAGPVFLGSGSILTALFDKSKQADVHFGLRFGGLQKKTKKAKEPETVAAVIAPVFDADGDGVNDGDDKCPTLPGLAKYNGCPVPDTDADGVNDENDKCPTVAGLVKYNGCPIPDTDKDGVNDEDDKCIDVAGLARYQGCPIPDTDNDGLNDEDDKCPTIAGLATNKGCPEIKKEIIKRITYSANNIYFATGAYTLLAKSNKGLDDVALVLKQNPDLKLYVDGHTDNVGKPEKNQLLSENRANAVKAYLVKKGVDASRVISTGYGDTKPVADNKTAAGRTKNRRVEMKADY